MREREREKKIEENRPSSSSSSSSSSSFLLSLLLQRVVPNTVDGVLKSIECLGEKAFVPFGF